MLWRMCMCVPLAALLLDAWEARTAPHLPTLPFGVCPAASRHHLSCCAHPYNLLFSPKPVPPLPSVCTPNACCAPPSLCLPLSLSLISSSQFLINSSPISSSPSILLLNSSPILSFCPPPHPPGRAPPLRPAAALCTQGCGCVQADEGRGGGAKRGAVAQPAGLPGAMKWLAGWL